jgi:tetratricopeptide (TPR) repeat protein
MNTIVFTLLFQLLSLNSAVAHTCSYETVKCPIDSTKVEFCVTNSMTTFGSFRDFQKQGAIGNHYEELINSCPKCRFSGYLKDFKEKYSDSDRNKISDFLSKYKGVPINHARECAIAAEIKSLLNKSNEEIAFCYVNGSYLLRSDENEVAFRKELQLKAKNYLILALEHNEYEDITVIPNINYLIAEMSRRIGAFDEAIFFYDKAINDTNKQDWVELVAIEQKELAIKKDDNNEI